MNGKGTWWGAALVLAAGITLGGWFVGQGFLEGRQADRHVTVKGFAERIVKADLALWPMRFVATGNDLTRVQEKLRSDAAAILAFLADAGIPRAAVELQNVEVTDLLAQAYRSGPVESRFIVAQTLMVRTDDVDRIIQASQKLDALVDAGVVLSSEMGPSDSGPFYLFTRLNDLKPEMIAEATRNARAAALQFAEDSGSVLGGIRNANQGLFQILPRDDTPGMMEPRQVMKTVRVVSTIQYLLLD